MVVDRNLIGVKTLIYRGQIYECKHNSLFTDVKGWLFGFGIGDRAKVVGFGKFGVEEIIMIEMLEVRETLHIEKGKFMCMFEPVSEVLLD